MTTLAVIVNLILCASVVTAMVGLLARSIPGSRVDRHAVAVKTARRQPRPRPTPARSGARVRGAVRPTA